ncbi:MAG TPA: hypothetical protein VNP92_23210, partial [Actinophytocola sp.]|nr:hypothetical protein [Actinophytocola sp.]
FSRDTEGLVDVINRLLTAPVERPAAAPPVPASSSNDRWQANLHRYQTTGARTLEIHLANGDEEHTILVKWTAWRDSIAIDDRVIATSLGKGLVGRRHTFVLQGESGDVAGAILISEDPATKDEFFQYYLLDRLTIDGQEIPGIWEN